MVSQAWSAFEKPLLQGISIDLTLDADVEDLMALALVHRDGHAAPLPSSHVSDRDSDHLSRNLAAGNNENVIGPTKDLNCTQSIGSAMIGPTRTVPGLVAQKRHCPSRHCAEDELSLIFRFTCFGIDDLDNEIHLVKYDRPLILPAECEADTEFRGAVGGMNICRREGRANSFEVLRIKALTAENDPRERGLFLRAESINQPEHERRRRHQHVAAVATHCFRDQRRIFVSQCQRESASFLDDPGGLILLITAAIAPFTEIALHL
ncbi:MAG: hypothetical protein HLUCCO17_05945 [Saliniramus fredricksonii]|uniref:Uncharacterized protein n=1 Tax=Saliniramus fredricksonii TaxID=1653334 RepID=A0A0P8BQ90_9HYPH|nr:MAG: hypothetical protein HLUCCO17_05945 [Saliniramus fredricksonii]SCC80184.1 hypothetical protein GA0071312_1330 [Saliniramus fredricksonii]